MTSSNLGLLVKQCEQQLGIMFQNIDFLKQALTHASYANEQNQPISNNERLEYLGDAVLELAISEYLFHTYTESREGDLTRMRSFIVREPTLADAARSLKLGKYVALGKGEVLSGGRKRAALLADAFEAVVGAIYLDKGFAAAKSFIVSNLGDALRACASGQLRYDYKTTLQEYIQSLEGQVSIEYDLISEQGPDHAKVFQVGLRVDGELVAEAQGRTKKEAEQNAAQRALSRLKKADLT